MKLTKINTPEWMKKIDLMGRGKIFKWQTGVEQPPKDIRCFIIARLPADPTDPKNVVLNQLGVTLSAHIENSDINTGNIPYANLQKVCELDFIDQIEFPKLHQPN